MQSIYLIENLSTPAATPTYAKTTPVFIPAQNTVVIYDDNLPLLKRGQYFSIAAGAKYPIESFKFDSLTLTYTLILAGGLAPQPKASTDWAVHDAVADSNYIQLDTEGVDITTVFKVSEIADISTRKDTITKNIVLKGTETNNRAFGNLFFFNRNADTRITNRLFFNYTPLRTVDCIIYDDRLVILRGQLLITEINAAKDGSIYYQATITGNFVGFKSAVGDAALTDLNLNDMGHDYTALEIVDSWGGFGGTPSIGNSRTHWTNLVSGDPFTKPFEPGVGYVYPMIDYGEKFQNPDYNSNYGRFKIQNFRPAVYVREYFKRIFDNAGFTFEIKGSPDLLNKFNRAFIPDSGASLTSLQNNAAGRFTTEDIALFNSFSSPSVGYNYHVNFADEASQTETYSGQYGCLIQFQNTIIDDRFEWDDQLYPNQPITGEPAEQREKVLIRVKNNIEIAARLTANGSVTFGPSAGPDGLPFRVQLCRRDRRADDAVDSIENIDEWFNGPEVIGEQVFFAATGSTVNWDVDFVTPVTMFEQGQQIFMRIIWNLFINENQALYLTNAEIKFPAVDGSLYNVEVKVGDRVVPKAPENVKQIDFIKSICSVFNFYVTPEKDRPRHLIFETRDEYYALASPLVMATTALNWSGKIDYQKEFKIKSNLDIPKKYLFSFKEDGDFLNSTYKDRNGLPYGSFRFNDTYGFTDEKTVAVIFSPTPPAAIPGLARMIPIITKDGVDLAKKGKIKSNIRILFYSGLFYDPAAPIIGEDFWNTTGTRFWDFTYTFATDFYPLSGNYLFSDYNDIFHPATSTTEPLLPTHDVHFGAPAEYFFNPADNFLSVPNSYGYYRQQTTELTNANMFTLDIGATLNEIDIANLSLKIPIFVDAGSNGHAYFKILSVTYKNQKTVSTLTLQKIV